MLFSGVWNTLFLVVLGTLVAGLSAAWSAEVSTRDGLALRLEDRTGAARGVSVDGRTLPLLRGARGGFFYREFQRVETGKPQVLAAAGFEEGLGPCERIAGAAAAPEETAAVALRDDGGTEGSRGYARLGATRQYGHGVRLRERIPVTAGTLLEIAWQGRVPSLDATYILYIRVFDAADRDITESAAPPTGWQYSPWTKTHYQYQIPLQAAGAWERVSRAYCAPEGAAAIDVAYCLWRGDYVDVDSLSVSRTGGVVWGKPAPLAGKLVRDPASGSLRQEGKSPDGSLSFTARYTPASNHLRVDVDLQANPPDRIRPLRVWYALPVDVSGWTWQDDAFASRTIEREQTYASSRGLSGHPLSCYPFASACGPEAGLSLGAPMDVPRLQAFSYGPEGYRTTVDFALSPETTKLGPGRATFSFVLFRHESDWGFRAAAEKYYRVFPESFVRRVKRDGCWMWPVQPGEIKDPADFGFGFLEYSALPEAERRRCQDLGILAFFYIEPIGLRQWHPKIPTREEVPSWQDAVKELEAWAAETGDTPRWAGSPRPERARALLAAVLRNRGGEPRYFVDRYGTFAHWWMLNPDPDIPGPGHGSLCLRDEVEPALAAADGIYVDSVGSWDFEDWCREHFAGADIPLSYSLESGEAFLAGDFAHHDFYSVLASRLHDDGKLVMMNFAPAAFRMHAHLCDVLGLEVTDLQKDAEAMLQRLYAGTKPVSNLLQYHSAVQVRVPQMTHEEVEAFIKQQMFYGFFPGFSTIGGGTEPGYAHMKRYFRSPEQYERDRDLFVKYIPVIRRLSAAGWEPVTRARPNDPAIRVERFGRLGGDGLYFTVRNTAETEKRAALRVEVARLAAPGSPPRTLAATDLLSGRPLALRTRDGECQVDLSLAAGDTTVIALGPA